MQLFTVSELCTQNVAIGALALKKQSSFPFASLTTPWNKQTCAYKSCSVKEALSLKFIIKLENKEKDKTSPCALKNASDFAILAWFHILSFSEIFSTLKLKNPYNKRNSDSLLEHTSCLLVVDALHCWAMQSDFQFLRPLFPSTNDTRCAAYFYWITSTQAILSVIMWSAENWACCFHLLEQLHTPLFIIAYCRLVDQFSNIFNDSLRHPSLAALSGGRCFGTLLIIFNKVTFSLATITAGKFRILGLWSRFWTNYSTNHFHCSSFVLRHFTLHRKVLWSVTRCLLDT